MDEGEYLISTYDGYYFAQHPRIECICGCGESIGEAVENAKDIERQLNLRDKE